MPKTVKGSTISFGSLQILRTTLYITALCSLLFSTACSRKPPPPPARRPAAPAKTVVDTSKESETDRSKSREERVEAIAKDKFNLYQRKLKVVDFPRAEAALRDLRSVFDTERQYKAFWDQSIPASKRRVLTLMSLCEACKDGLCNTCKGTAKCEICKGTGKCGNCEGAPVRRVECRACLCSDCSGTGKCRSCRGFKNSQCPACSGFGTVSAATSVECRRCGGTGSTPGLRGANGVVSRLKCLTCRGSGRVQKTILNMCTVCSGKGRIPCTTCGGVGRCKTCGGDGRNPSCAICGGKTYTIHKCPQCEGDGKCRNCDGTGNCKTCHGTGKCFECDGGVVTLYNFPVNGDWLTIKSGHVFYDSKLRKIVDKDGKSGNRSIAYKNININVLVSEGQIMFITTQPAFDSVAEIMAK